MADAEIRELAIPAGESSPGWHDLMAQTELYNALNRKEIGSADLDETAQQVLAQVTSPYSTDRLFRAVLGDRLAGLGIYGLEHGQTVAWVWTGVAADQRRTGLGTRLAQILETTARQAGATALQTWTWHADTDGEPRLHSPAGPGSVPAGAPSARFLLSQGFKLGQVEIISALPLPVPADLLTMLSERSRPSGDYDLIGWTGPVPHDRVDEYARLRTIASTAAPSGELTEEEQVWDADRVRHRDEQNKRAGKVSVVTAARHQPTGELVAFTGLVYPAAADGRAVDQGYTMVLPEHRGHNLGLKIKINNLRLLNAADHGAQRVVTGNAGENAAMLSINRALGFRPFVLNGSWEKKL